MTKNDKKAFASNIVGWFEENKRDLPWRDTTNPYYILVSEIMLQQTQVKTVIPYYFRFIETLPSLEDLALANEELLHYLWEGLGYYSRVRRLQSFAIQVVNEYKGIIPSDKSTLLKLPGIGPYTCGALRSFAFHEKEVAMDGNVKRVIARLLGSHRDIMKQETHKYFSEVLEKLLPDNIYSFNQGLIELGALICKPKSPKCDVCPVCFMCKAYNQDLVEVLPVKKPKNKAIEKNVPILVICDKGEILFVKRQTVGVLANLWGLPMVEDHCEEEDLVKQLKEYLWSEFDLSIDDDFLFLGKTKHVFSHIIWNQYIYCIEGKDIRGKILHLEKPEWTWRKVDEISLPTAFKKSLKLIK